MKAYAVVVDLCMSGCKGYSGEYTTDGNAASDLLQAILV